jgi:large conductance mechanosensitive channel
MGFIKEFRDFAVKGNVIDLAVGVIIGAAFGKIVDSVVNDLIMPIVAAIIGQPDFSNLYVVLKGDVPAGTALADARKIAGAVIFAYGNFITVLINFILLAFIIFLMVKAVNKLRRKHEEVTAAPPAPSATEQLLTDIRDELRKRP